MQSVVMLSVVMLNVVAYSWEKLYISKDYFKMVKTSKRLKVWGFYKYLKRLMAIELYIGMLIGRFTVHALKILH